MPFHPNGLDHETLKKLAKNLRKGFSKVFPNTPCTTAQSQNLLALELGYEHWHEAIAVRDPSLLATSTGVDATPSLDELLDPLRATLPQGALLITGWDRAMNADLFKVLRQHGQEDRLTVFNPVFEPSRNVRITMKLEDPTETLDLFKPSVGQAVEHPSSIEERLETPPGRSTTPARPTAQECLDLFNALRLGLEHETAPGYGRTLHAAMTDLLVYLQARQDHVLADLVEQRWLPLAEESWDQPNTLVRRMAGFVYPVSPKAAYALGYSIKGLREHTTSWSEVIARTVEHLTPPHPFASGNVLGPGAGEREPIIGKHLDPSTLRWNDLDTTALIFESLAEYMGQSFSGVDALRALAKDLKHLGHPDRAQRILDLWLPRFEDAQIGPWTQDVARELMPHSPRAAHALLRTAHMHLAGTFQHGLVTVATLLREEATLKGSQAHRSGSARSVVHGASGPSSSARAPASADDA